MSFFSDAQKLLPQLPQKPVSRPRGVFIVSVWYSVQHVWSVS